MARAGIALGSNLGDRHAHLAAAIRRLRLLAVPTTPVLEASFLETPPLNCPPGSPDFLNTVVEIEYAGTPFELLDHLQNIERSSGRIRGAIRNAPRTLDLDLLYFGDLTLSGEALELPHPRLSERRFVLAPLAEIRPDLILPGQRRSIREILSQLE